jgi:radical SAM superfamily enzyme YgiQ (UPF0313 family)
MRIVSAQLQTRGIDTYCFFLDSIAEKYPADLLRAVAGKVAGSALVGVSVVEMGKSRAIDITRFLQHNHGLKVLWGGTYPTLSPEEAIEFADYVCVGEGDDMVHELAMTLTRQEDLRNVPNLVYRNTDGTVEQTRLGRLVSPLDNVPFADYFTPDRHYDISPSGALRKMVHGYPRMERSTLRFKRNLWMMFGRGCHLKCTYCSVPSLADTTRGLGPFFRFKSPRVMIEEIEWALERNNGADYVYIMDNDFCALPLRKLDEFCEFYQDRIRLPFLCYGTPVTITLDKVRSLARAGVERLDLGIQSGSDRVLKIYGRRTTKREILEAAEAIATAIEERRDASPLAGYPGWPVKPYFDVIFNAPFETREDLEETIDVIKRIGRMGFDFGLYCQPLTFFENTGLYDQAASGQFDKLNLEREQILAGLSYQQIAEHIVARGNHLYLNTLIYWMRYDHTRWFAGIVPRILLHALTAKETVDFFERVDHNPLFRFLAQVISYSMPTRDRRYFVRRSLRSHFLRICNRVMSVRSGPAGGGRSNRC